MSKSSSQKLDQAKRRAKDAKKVRDQAIGDALKHQREARRMAIFTRALMEGLEITLARVMAVAEIHKPEPDEDGKNAQCVECRAVAIDDDGKCDTYKEMETLDRDIRKLMHAAEDADVPNLAAQAVAMVPTGENEPQKPTESHPEDATDGAGVDPLKPHKFEPPTDMSQHSPLAKCAVCAMTRRAKRHQV